MSSIRSATVDKFGRLQAPATKFPFVSTASANSATIRVDRWLWPAIAHLANSLNKKSLAALLEEHSPSGEHKVRTVPFPRWVPAEVHLAAENLSKEEACLQLGDWMTLYLRKGIE
jgi:hypothetical protein